MPPPLLLVAAVARNGVIGANNRLLWRLSSDLKRFKALTMGKPLVMGRKTFAVDRPAAARTRDDRRHSRQGFRGRRRARRSLARGGARARRRARRGDGRGRDRDRGRRRDLRPDHRTRRPSRHHRGRARARRRRALSRRSIRADGARSGARRASAVRATKRISLSWTTSGSASPARRRRLTAIPVVMAGLVPATHAVMRQ